MTVPQHVLFICSNTDVICDGQEWPDEWQEECASEFVSAAARMVLDSTGPVDYDTASFFADWRRGRHSKCGCQIAGKPWGYSAGLVVCHTRETPKYVKALCDRADAAGWRAAEQFLKTIEVGQP